MLADNKVLAARVLAADENDDIGGDNGLNDRSKHVESKPEKSAKSGNLKGKKLAKFKKPSKSRNSPNFGVMEPGSSFLTLKARSAFDRL